MDSRLEGFITEGRTPYQDLDRMLSSEVISISWQGHPPALHSYGDKKDVGYGD